MDYKKYCSLNFNGVLLDQQIPGYITINVEGRGFLNRDPETGELPDREIKVHFLIEQDNNKSFRRSLQQLQALLFSDGEDVVFSFGDENGTRIGRYIAGEDPPFDYFTGIGTFTLLCEDPFLYSSPSDYSETIGELSVYGSVPDIISAAPKEATNKLVITNSSTGRKIVLNHAIEAGQEVEIRIPENKLTIGRKPAMAALDYLTSDFHNFIVFTNNEIQMKPAGTITLKVRRRDL